MAEAHILLAIDLTDAPEAVVDAGVTWARRYGRRIDLGYVSETQATLYLARSERIRALAESEAEAIAEADRAALEALLLRMPEEVRGIVRYGTEQTVPTLKSWARNYDLMLVTTRGKRGLARWMLGSVAERVVREAPCSVLILRLPTDD